MISGIDTRNELLGLSGDLNSSYYPFWLLVQTGGWLSRAPGNIPGMVFSIKHLPEGSSVLEIGTYLGQSACMITYLMWKHSRFAPFFCCDPYHFENTDAPIGGFFDAGSQVFREYCRETAKRNLQVFSAHHLPFLVEDYSQDFLAAWGRHEDREDVFGRRVRLGGPLGFVYIDGAHTYEAAKADFEGSDPFLVPGGFVLFDDSTPNWPGPHAVAREVLGRHDYELVATLPNYLLRKV